MNWYHLGPRFVSARDYGFFKARAIRSGGVLIFGVEDLSIAIGNCGSMNEVREIGHGFCG